MSRLKAPYFGVSTDLELMLWFILKKHLLVAYQNNKVIAGVIILVFSPALLFIFIPGVQVLVSHQDALVWQCSLIMVTILPWPVLRYVFLQNRVFLCQLSPTRGQLFLSLLLHFTKRYLMIYPLWLLPFVITWSDTNLDYLAYFSSFILTLVLILLLTFAISVELLSFQPVCSLNIPYFKNRSENSLSLLLTHNWKRVLIRVIVLIIALHLFETNDAKRISIAIALMGILWTSSINADVKLLKDFPFFSHLTGRSASNLRWNSMLPVDLLCFAISVISYVTIRQGPTAQTLSTAAYLACSYIVAFAFAQQSRITTMPIIIFFTILYAGIQLSLIS